MDKHFNDIVSEYSLPEDGVLNCAYFISEQVIVSVSYKVK